MACLMTYACSEWNLERTEFTKVITIGTIEVGSSSAFLIGDIENIRMSRVIESGFVLSASSNTDDALRLDQPDIIFVVSPGLDTISEDRAFAARVTELNSATNYFFRGYAKIEGEQEVIYGNIDEFNTADFSVEILSVTRNSPGCPLSANVELKIGGFSSSSGSEVGIVYSTNPAILFPDVNNGQSLGGAFPDDQGILDINIDLVCDQTYFIRGFLKSSDAEILYSDVFGFSTSEYGTWSARENFPGAPRQTPIQFIVNNELVLGGGHASRIFSDYFTYDILTDNWTNLGSFEELEITAGVGFSTFGLGYLLAGRVDFSKCNLTGRCPDYSDARNIACLGVGIEGCAFANLSCASIIVPCDCYNNKIFQYNPDNRSWIEFDEFEGAERKSPLVFQYEEQVFFGSGIGLIPPTTSPSACECRLTYCESAGGSKFKNDWWQFDGSQQTWNQKESMPIEAANMLGIGFVVDGKIVTGLGKRITYIQDARIQEERLKGFYEYDPSSPNASPWRTIVDLQKEPADFNVGFSSNSHGYALSYYDLEPEPIVELQQYDPSMGVSGSWTQLQVPTQLSGIPQVASTSGNLTFVYFTSSNQNFWMYVPPLG